MQTIKNSLITSCCFCLVNQKHIKIKKNLLALLNLVNKLLIHVHIFIIMIFLKNKTVEIQPVSKKKQVYIAKKKKELLFEQAYFEIWFKYYQEHWFFLRRFQHQQTFIHILSRSYYTILIRLFMHRKEYY